MEIRFRGLIPAMLPVYQEKIEDGPEVFLQRIQTERRDEFVRMKEINNDSCR